jgi:hypothetical protein
MIIKAAEGYERVSSLARCYSIWDCCKSPEFRVTNYLLNIWKPTSYSIYEELGNKETLNCIPSVACYIPRTTSWQFQHRNATRLKVAIYSTCTDKHNKNGTLFPQIPNWCAQQTASRRLKIGRCLGARYAVISGICSITTTALLKRRPESCMETVDTHTVHRSRVDPHKDASLAAKQGSASGSNIRYYPK